MDNFYLVPKSEFQQLDFLGKMSVGATALLLSTILLIIGILLLKSNWLPFLKSYYSKFEIGLFSVGTISTVSGIVIALTYIGLIFFAVIVSAAIFFLVSNL